MQKFILILTAFLLIACTSLAQQDEAVSWTNRLDEAKTIATQNHLDILMVFAGSDWCHPCMQFKKEILESSVFQEYARGKVVILYLDFPARRKNQLPEEQKKHNESLAERYNKSGAFPNILLIDVNEEVLGTIPYKQQSPDTFQAQLEELKPLTKS